MTLDHADLRKLAQAAKQGPWFPRATDDASFMNARYVGLDEGPGFVHDGANGMALGEADATRVIAITLLQEPRLADCDECDENAKFIAAANPTTVLALLDEIERLRKENVELDLAAKLGDALAVLLDRSATALKGEAAPGSRHDCSDLPDVAAALRARVTETDENVDALADENAALRLRVADLEAAVEAVRVLIRESSGVAGLHANGAVAPWEELLAGGRCEGWLVNYSAALALLEKKPAGGDGDEVDTYDDLTRLDGQVEDRERE